METASLHTLSTKVVVKQVLSCTQYLEKPENAALVYQYLMRAAPFLGVLAEECRYHEDAGLTQLFLPVLLQNGRLHITAANISKVEQYCSDKERDMLLSVTHLKTGYILEKPLGPILGKLAGLKVLVIKSSVDNDLMALLGASCPQLTILDASKAGKNSLTDEGLAHLQQCKRLKRIYLCCDCFGCLDNDPECPVGVHHSCLQEPRYSGKGIAQLLLLPEMEKVQCPGYLLADALIHLNQTGDHKPKLPVQCIYLNLRQCGSHYDDALQLLPVLCPKLKIVSLTDGYDYGDTSVIGNSLKSLLQLEALVIHVDDCRFESMKFADFGSKLLYLHVSFVGLEGHELLHLSQSCSQLKMLVLELGFFDGDVVYNHDEDIVFSNIGQVQEPLFPSVTALQVIGRVPVTLLKLLSIKMENLKEFSCSDASFFMKEEEEEEEADAFMEDFYVDVEDFNEPVKVILQNGGWKNLEMLALPIGARESELSWTTFQLIIDSLPSLMCILACVEGREQRDIDSFLKNTSPNVKLLEKSQISTCALLKSSKKLIGTNLWQLLLGKHEDCVEV